MAIYETQKLDDGYYYHTVGAKSGQPVKGRPSIRQNRWDNWYGFLGTTKVQEFYNDSQGSQEDNAKQWLAEQLNIYEELK